MIITLFNIESNSENIASKISLSAIITPLKNLLMAELFYQTGLEGDHLQGYTDIVMDALADYLAGNSSDRYYYGTTDEPSNIEAFLGTIATSVAELGTWDSILYYNSCIGNKCYPHRLVSISAIVPTPDGSEAPLEMHTITYAAATAELKQGIVAFLTEFAQTHSIIIETI